MNGANITGPLTVPETGGWQNWQNVSKAVTLVAGPQILRLVVDTAGTVVGNFDSIQFTAGTGTVPPVSSTRVLGNARADSWHGRSGTIRQRR